MLELKHDQLSVYGIASDYTEDQLREVMGLLQARGLLVRNEGEFATLAVSQRGWDFLKNKEKLSLPRLKSSADEVRARTSSRGISERNAASLAEDYDQELFEELRALRRDLADQQEVSPFVVFWDSSLRYMSAAFPQSLESFSRTPGVGKAKLEQYGERFVAAIRAYAGPRNIADRTVEVASSFGRETTGRESRREGREGRRSDTYEQTLALLEQGMNISQIAQERGLAETTIIGQIERMAAQGRELSLEHLLPEADRLLIIRDAFDICGQEYLKPVREYLGPEFSYEEIRVTRLYLRREEVGEAE